MALRLELRLLIESKNIYYMSVKIKMYTACVGIYLFPKCTYCSPAGGRFASGSLHSSRFGKALFLECTLQKAESGYSYSAGAVLTDR
jgi:hypothetical protein